MSFSFTSTVWKILLQKWMCWWVISKDTRWHKMPSIWFERLFTSAHVLDMQSTEIMVMHRLILIHSYSHKVSAYFIWQLFCLLSNLARFFVACLFFFKINISENSFRNTMRVSNSVDPDQAQHFVAPDLVPNCLKRLSAKVSSRQRVNWLLLSGALQEQ